MERYIVLTGVDSGSALCWEIYDRVKKITLHYQPRTKLEAWMIADRLNFG
jgi:hypothetical protein